MKHLLLIALFLVPMMALADDVEVVDGELTAAKEAELEALERRMRYLLVPDTVVYAGETGIVQSRFDQIGKMEAPYPYKPHRHEREMVGSTVHTAIERFLPCYERELADNPDLSGIVMTVIEINARGKVRSAEVVHSNMGDRNVEACVERQFRHIEFLALSDHASEVEEAAARWRTAERERIEDKYEEAREELPEDQREEGEALEALQADRDEALALVDKIRLRFEKERLVVSYPLYFRPQS